MSKTFLIAGPCAIEDKELPFFIAEKVKGICDRLGIEYIFKGSYRKANRSRLDSFTGIGDEKALKIIQAVGEKFGVETITDVHESYEPAKVAPYVNHLQIPAFLCRQTDLLLAAGKTGLGVNIKKGQFVSPDSMVFAVEKVKSTGNQKVWLTERGFSFGYSDLVVDATAIHKLAEHGVPVVMDCTHSVQKPNQTAGVTGGDPSLIETIALSAAATGASGFFFEVHPDPKSAKSDPHTMLQLDKLEPILEKILKVKQAVS
ncbi:MAG: 3-deoxy-8-phosphooctulonate synthase [Flavobacteriales bacterium]|jgi:2-dehydro-3-deoxyphosphooctonate aldolase (KDO 8-P synthase)|nr:3-deoxy-8-phosphooctulonate synthase [Flavobacteriales bacterium]